MSFGDALSIKQTSGTSYIIGGGAFHASDKIVQHNGGGTVSIKDFYAEDFGKVGIRQLRGVESRAKVT